MISEVHAGGINSATYASEKETSLVTPETKEPTNVKEQSASQNSSPSTIVSLGNNTKSDLQTYSKQSILANAASENDSSTATVLDAAQPTVLAAEPEVTTSAFGGTKKPPP